MAKQAITVDLDEQTVRALTALGDPSAVLEKLAASVTDGLRHASRERRTHTDESLRTERATSDTATAATPALTGERKTTDKDLTGERAHVDSVLVDQREANAQMVSATIRAGELAEEAALARDRAEASERELRRIAEFREMFIGVLGHDLRSPLAAIVMAGGLLLRGGRLNEHDRETVTRMLRSSQRMSRMITQLLDLTQARIGGGLTMERKPMDLRELCRDVVEEFEARVQLVTEGELTGNWDHDRLAEVLTNLTGNALDYATPGTAVKIEAHGEEAAVVIAIENEGPPIPPEVLPFIFEPFRRGEKKKSAAGNLGLGLYIADQIVLAHGGSLMAQSAGGITRFVIRLPRHAM
jgi:signal transduction histidine kinase